MRFLNKNGLHHVKCKQCEHEFQLKEFPADRRDLFCPVCHSRRVTIID
jgi:Zn finger protein HypA/HybF involved in hydrogenase expression